MQVSKIIAPRGVANITPAEADTREEADREKKSDKTVEKSLFPFVGALPISNPRFLSTRGPIFFAPSRDSRVPRANTVAREHSRRLESSVKIFHSPVLADPRKYPARGKNKRLLKRNLDGGSLFEVVGACRIVPMGVLQGCALS